NLKNKCIFILLALVQIGFAQDNENIVIGRVTNGISPLKNVAVQISDASTNTSTDENGYYQIKASPLDILVFSHIGMKDEEIVVEDVTTRLNIVMKMKIEELHEVNVTKNINRRSQDYMRHQYARDERIINTALGYVHKDYLGSSAYIVGGENLNPGAVDILTALRGKVPNLRIGTVIGPDGRTTERAVFLRAKSSISNPAPAIYDVDGIVMTQAPLFLIIQNVERVAVIPSLLATGRYGPLAVGGVIIINTRGTNIVREPGTNSLYDYAKLRDNIYQDDALDQEGVLRNSPSYLKDLYGSTNLTEAKKHYEHYAITLKTDPYFILDSYLFFSAKEARDYATELLQQNIGLFKNAVQCKALAYALEVTDKPDLANEYYKKIFLMRPGYAQSYRDLANNYVATGNYKRAANLYVRYLHLINEGFFPKDKSGISGIVKEEFMNLLTQHKSVISENSGLVLPSKDITRQEGTRILVEWNDSEAEFDLQFVHPEKQYFTWEHTTKSNPDRIRDEKIKGYSSEEFFIYEPLPEDWQVNVSYKGNKKLTATYLKLTVYRNYNTPSQRAISKLYRLRLKDVNQQLLDFSEVMTLP
ncbi:MAG: carboxypeptidase-like regulatory domain-containing protein, partial [Eudoraea sp.]|uniref:carboxypeptidase-like regulatory domain-containing protein n=1 Tax=Eudoraea sp. TaxID=1979955 RepID=UPI003C72AD66